MMKFVLLACFLVGAYASTPIAPLLTLTRNEGKIVGGQAAEISDVPWQVAALYDGSGIGSYSLRCGGSIVSSTVIITAAHCVDGTRDARWRVRAGSKTSNAGGQVIQVSKLVANERYNSNIDYDIAILWLASPLTLDGTNVRAVALPKQGDTVADGAAALISGWGSTTQGGGVTTSLRKVTIPVVNQQKCATAYASFNPITDRMICAGNFDAGGQDACQGDSGGPLVVGNVLMGVTSWGRGCAQKGYPGVWARVPSMMDWVNGKLE